MPTPLQTRVLCQFIKSPDFRVLWVALLFKTAPTHGAVVLARGPEYKYCDLMCQTSYVQAPVIAPLVSSLSMNERYM